MPGLGTGIGTSYRSKRPGGPATQPITALVSPASEALVVGQSLSDTANWASFVDPANYATSAPGESIASVVVNYIGDAANASDPLADGETNNFSLTVTDTGGAVRVFAVIPRVVVHTPPSVAGGLADQSFTAGTGLQSYDASGAFTGADLTFEVEAVSGVSIDTGTGLLQFDTDVLPPVPGTVVVVTATNSGGSASVSFEVDILAPLVYSATIAGLTESAGFGLHARIGTMLTGEIANLRVGDTLLHRWQDGSGVIGGADTANFTPTDSQDLETLRYVPLVNGTEVASPAYTIRHAPPVAGTLVPVVGILGDGHISVNLSVGFTGAALIFSENVPWAQITGSVLTIDDAPRDESVTITATNSGGQASLDLSVTIAEAPVTAPAPMIAPHVTAGSASHITVTLRMDPYDGGAPITSRDIRYSVDETNWTIVADVISPRAIMGLAAETEYFVQTRVVNEVGAGAWSPSVPVTTPAAPPAPDTLFNAERIGTDLTLNNIPDIVPQTFTAAADGESLILSFPEGVQDPAPRQVGIISTDNHDGTQPDTGALNLRVLNLETLVDGAYAVPASEVPPNSMVVLLAPQTDVVGGGLLEFSRVVFVGASIIEQTFGSDFTQRNSAVEDLFQDRGVAVEVYANAVGGSEALDVQTLLMEAMTTFTEDTLFFVHAGGNNVTASRPYPGDATALSEDLTGLIDIAATRPGSVILSDLTFRDYDATTAADEAAGTKPYNDNIYLPLFQARKADLMERAYYDDGTPVSCLYEWSYANRSVYLSEDNVHPVDPEGRGLLQAWLADRLAPLCLGQPAPAQVERAVLAPEIGTVDIFIEYGVDTAVGVNTPGFTLAADNAGMTSDGPFGVLNQDGSDLGVTLTLNFSAPAPGGSSGFGVNTQGRTTPVSDFDGTLYNDRFTTDSYFVGEAYTVDHVISGLQPDADYAVELIAARAASDSRETLYSFSNGETATIETTADPVSPPVRVNTRSDGAGSITITQSANTGGWSYLGGLHIFDI